MFYESAVRAGCRQRGKLVCLYPTSRAVKNKNKQRLRVEVTCAPDYVACFKFMRVGATCVYVHSGPSFVSLLNVFNPALKGKESIHFSHTKILSDNETNDLLQIALEFLVGDWQLQACEPRIMVSGNGLRGPTNGHETIVFSTWINAPIATCFWVPPVGEARPPNTDLGGQPEFPKINLFRVLKLEA